MKNNGPKDLESRIADSFIYCTDQLDGDLAQEQEDLRAYCKSINMEFIVIDGFSASEIAQSLDKAMLDLEAKGMKAPFLVIAHHGTVDKLGNHVFVVGDELIRTDVLQKKMSDLPIVQKLGLAVHQTACYGGQSYSEYFNPSKNIAWLPRTPLNSIAHTQNIYEFTSQKGISLGGIREFLDVGTKSAKVNPALNSIPDIMSSNSLVERKEYKDRTIAFKPVRTIQLIKKFVNEDQVYQQEFINKISGKTSNDKLLDKDGCKKLFEDAKTRGSYTFKGDEPNFKRKYDISMLTEDEKWLLVRSTLKNDLGGFKQAILETKNSIKHSEDLDQIHTSVATSNFDVGSISKPYGTLADPTDYEVKYIVSTMLRDHMHKYGEEKLGYRAYSNLNAQEKELLGRLATANEKVSDGIYAIEVPVKDVEPLKNIYTEKYSINTQNKIAEYYDPLQKDLSPEELKQVKNIYNQERILKTKEVQENKEVQRNHVWNVAELLKIQEFAKAPSKDLQQLKEIHKSYNRIIKTSLKDGKVYKEAKEQMMKIIGIDTSKSYQNISKTERPRSQSFSR